MIRPGGNKIIFRQHLFFFFRSSRRGASRSLDLLTPWCTILPTMSWCLEASGNFFFFAFVVIFHSDIVEQVFEPFLAPPRPLRAPSPHVSRRKGYKDQQYGIAGEVALLGIGNRSSEPGPTTRACRLSALLARRTVAVVVVALNFNFRRIPSGVS